MIRLQFYLWSIGGFLRYGTGNRTLREWFFDGKAVGSMGTGDLFFTLRLLGVTVMFQFLWWTKQDEAQANPQLQPTVPCGQSDGWDEATEGNSEVVGAWVKMLATKQVKLVIYQRVFRETPDRSIVIAPENDKFVPSSGDKVALGNPEQFVVVTMQGSKTAEDGTVTHFYR